MQVISKIEHQVYKKGEPIMDAFREGDKDAFRLVYDQVVRPLTFFAEGIVLSHTDAEDIVANAFYKLFHARAELKTYEHVKRWLYVIVRNEAIDYLRLKAKQRESQRYMAWFESGAEEQAETERVKTVLLQSILEEIEKLPRQRKTILHLYFFEQKTTAEIAEIMGLSTQTVLNHKSRAIESLRQSGLKFKGLFDAIPGLLLAAAFYLLK